MRDVVRMGTAARAMKLGRSDLAGKTGTTNDFIDAWFCGFNASLVAVAWIGFDTPQTLGPQRNRRARRAADLDGLHGRGAEGRAGAAAHAARRASSRRAINPDTGLRVDGRAAASSDFFYQEFLPPGAATTWRRGVAACGDRPPEEVRNQLF